MDYGGRPTVGGFRLLVASTVRRRRSGAVAHGQLAMMVDGSTRAASAATCFHEMPKLFPNTQ